MAPKVYIDGFSGTTGLRIHEWLARRTDLELLTPDREQRRDPAVRRAHFEAADVAVLCLPDAASREAAEWADAADCRLIDASTAFRVEEGWVYGLPEMSAGQREAIANARHVSNPGCYPTAVILGLRPLTDAGLLVPDASVSVHALSGYSGGGRDMIERWEDPASGLLSLHHDAPYALSKVHKHIPEMTRYSGLRREPHFLPAVGPYPIGMRVQVSLHADGLAKGATGKQIHAALRDRYQNEAFVQVVPYDETPPEGEHDFDPRAFDETNTIELRVIQNPLGHVLVMGRLDNLGKGASGAAVQSLNLMLGLDETAGL